MTPLVLIPALSLERVPRCPRCKRMASRAVLDEGALECEKCGNHWWVIRLAAGDVWNDVAERFAEPPWILELLQLYRVPSTLVESMYWQLSMTGQDWHRYITDREQPFRWRSHRFLEGKFQLHKRAS